MAQKPTTGPCLRFGACEKCGRTFVSFTCASARISHRFTAADADLLELPLASQARSDFAALNAARVLDPRLLIVGSSTPARPDSRSPCEISHLHVLASRIGEIFGLEGNSTSRPARSPEPHRQRGRGVARRSTVRHDDRRRPASPRGEPAIGGVRVRHRNEPAADIETSPNPTSKAPEADFGRRARGRTLPVRSESCASAAGKIIQWRLVFTEWRHVEAAGLADSAAPCC